MYLTSMKNWHCFLTATRTKKEILLISLSRTLQLIQIIRTRTVKIFSACCFTNAQLIMISLQRDICSHVNISTFYWLLIKLMTDQKLTYMLHASICFNTAVWNHLFSVTSIDSSRKLRSKMIRYISMKIILKAILASLVNNSNSKKT